MPIERVHVNKDTIYIDINHNSICKPTIKINLYISNIIDII